MRKIGNFRATAISTLPFGLAALLVALPLVSQSETVSTRMLVTAFVPDSARLNGASVTATSGTWSEISIHHSDGALIVTVRF